MEGGGICEAMEHASRPAGNIRTGTAALVFNAVMAVMAAMVLMVLTAVAGCRDNGAGNPGRREIEGVGAPDSRVQGSPGGMVVHIDPETGELRDTPAPGTEPVPGGDVRMPDRMIDGKK